MPPTVRDPKDILLAQLGLQGLSTGDGGVCHVSLWQVCNNPMSARYLANQQKLILVAVTVVEFRGTPLSGCWQGVGWVLVVRQTSMGAGRRELHSEENDLTPPAFLWGLTAGGGIKLLGISRKERGWSQGSSIH